MSDRRSYFFSSCLACVACVACLACHRAARPAHAVPSDPGAGPGPTAAEASPLPPGEAPTTVGAPATAHQAECTQAAIKAHADTWHDGAACVELLAPKCEQGDPDACMDAATILVNGIGGAAQDPAGALALVTSACERRVAAACIVAAVLHGKGLGVPADAAAAASFMARACELGEKGACKALAARAPRGPAFIDGADLTVESIAADGLELRDLMCDVTGGMPMLGALVIAGSLAKHKRGLDRCAPAGQAFAVTWTFAGGQARDITATGGAKLANACVARALANTAATLDGRCGAIVLVGKVAGATATLEAVRGGPPNPE